MSNIIVEHSKIYKSYFNAPYIIADSSTGGNKASKSGSADNIGFIEKYRGIDVMTPATVGDLYGMAGISQTYTDENWGWRDLRGARAVRARNGYILDLPKPEDVR
ncbi:MAG TPA: hypothetical protein [Siphovirus UK_ancient_CT89]|nr:MAG TPA: hypothetical protein [Siphovirus UK_ancient_CT89]